MKTPLLLLLVVGCGSDTKSHTRAFVASTTCGQGPYDVHFRADGTTGGDGIEIIACTPRRISGHVMFAASGYEIANHAFGDVADNQRCMGGRPTVVTASASGEGGASAATAGEGRATAAAPTLVERPYTGSETPFPDKLCEQLGLTAQEILMPTILTRTSIEGSFVPAGADLHVRLWSDVPNDLDGVVFMIRHLTSTKSPQQMKREEEKRDKRDDKVVERPRTPEGHGPPPAPLVEEQPPQPIATATWIPGYWSWTGTTWGWVAGFWRDERVAMPVPRAEVPGTAPQPNAIWIGGSWTLRAGQYVWIGGRWRVR